MLAPAPSDDRAPTAADRASKSAARAPRPVMAEQDSPVRAGEWDDNANYREFVKYLESEKHLPFQRLDLSARRFIVVRDSQGKAIPNCKVTVSDGQQHLTTLTTTASGRALLFPRAEGLTGSSLTAVASCLSTTASQKFELQADDGVVDLKLDAVRPAPQRTIDIAFVLDTTGSMSEEIESVKQTIRKVARELGKGDTVVRIALVDFKDKGDDWVTRVHDFSSDLDAFSRQIASIEADGGGDIPEHVNEGLRVAVEKLGWSNGASARLAFLIGDAPPHLDYRDDSGYGRAVKRAAGKGIQLYTIAASGMDDVGQVVWRQVAQYTGATNMFVLRGGAGSQSTGGGDPKSSCGGTQKNFSSGNLDELIVDKIQLTFTLLDTDPLKIAGLGQDENAKPCAERLVLAR
jgi:Mg-chelatase subunit ChlD